MIYPVDSVIQPLNNQGQTIIFVYFPKISTKPQRKLEAYTTRYTFSSCHVPLTRFRFGVLNSVLHWSILSRYFITNLMINICKFSTSYLKLKYTSMPQFTRKGCFNHVKPRNTRGDLDSSKQLTAGRIVPALRQRKSGVRDDFVSSVIYDRRFRFFETISHIIIIALTISILTGQEPPVYFEK